MVLNSEFATDVSSEPSHVVRIKDGAAVSSFDGVQKNKGEIQWSFFF